MPEIKIDVRDAIEGLHKHGLNEKQTKFLFAYALTKTAQYVKKDLTEIIPRNFDSPVPYTRNAVYNKFTSYDKTQMVVGIKGYREKGTPADKYLQSEVFGGVRGMKGSETLLMRRGYLQQGEALVPAFGVKLNQYGNVTAGTYQQILSALGAQSDRMQNTKGGKRKNVNTDNIFFAKMGKVKGIFKRGPRESLALLFQVVPLPHYRVRLPYNTIATRSANRHYGKAFNEALQYTLKNRR